MAAIVGNSKTFNNCFGFEWDLGSPEQAVCRMSRMFPKGALVEILLIAAVPIKPLLMSSYRCKPKRDRDCFLIINIEIPYFCHALVAICFQRTEIGQ